MKKVFINAMLIVLCLTILTGCDSGGVNESKNNDNNNTGETTTVEFVSSLAYDNCLTKAGVPVEVIPKSDPIKFNTKVIDYNDSGVAPFNMVDEDSVTVVDYSGLIRGAYFAKLENPDVEQFAVFITFPEAKFDDIDRHLYSNICLVNLENGEILSNIKESTKIGGKEITVKGSSFTECNYGEVQMTLFANVPAGYRDVGLYIADAESLNLTEAQLDFKKVIYPTNTSEIKGANAHLYTFDYSKFKNSGSTLLWNTYE